MIRTPSAGLKWLVLAAMFQAACDAPRAEGRAQAVQFLEMPHVKGTNLPRWAACLFPDKANPSAIRRAHPCPAESAPTVYRAEDLNGCWLITDDAGHPPIRTPFFSGPVRLQAPGLPGLRERGTPDAERYRIEPLEHIPDSLAYDTAGITTSWRFTAPDLVSISRSLDLGGVELSLRMRGDSMVGMVQGWGDIIEMSVDTAADPVTRIRGRRVRCSPPHEAVTTASSSGVSSADEG